MILGEDLKSTTFYWRFILVVAFALGTSSAANIFKKSNKLESTPGIGVCLAGAICGTVQEKKSSFLDTNSPYDFESSNSYSSFEICRCPGTRTCPLEWIDEYARPELADKVSISHGDMQYKYCYDAPNDELSTCKEDEVFYNNYMIYVSKKLVTMDSRLTCKCPATHKMTFKDIKTENLSPDTMVMLSRSTCSKPTCGADEPCRSLTVKPFYSSFSVCDCPKESRCSNHIGINSERHRLPKGSYYLNYCH